MRILEFVSTPAGILTSIERSFSTTPEPEHSLQGLEIICPVPWQFGQVVIWENCPSIVFVVC